MVQTGKPAREVGLWPATVIASNCMSILVTGRKVSGCLVTDELGLAIQEDIKGQRAGLLRHEWSGRRHYVALWHEVTALEVSGNEFHTETTTFKTRAAFEPIALGHTKKTETIDAKTLLKYTAHGNARTWTLNGASPSRVRSVLQAQLGRCGNGFAAAAPTNRTTSLATTFATLKDQCAAGTITDMEYEDRYAAAVKHAATSDARPSTGTDAESGKQVDVGTAAESAPSSKYEYIATHTLRNYSGGMDAHTRPEQSGVFALCSDAFWELRFPANGGQVHTVRGHIGRYPLTVDVLDPARCCVTIRNYDPGNKGGKFELLDTTSEQLLSEIAQFPAGVRSLPSGQWPKVEVVKRQLLVDTIQVLGAPIAAAIEELKDKYGYGTDIAGNGADLAAQALWGSVYGLVFCGANWPAAGRKEVIETVAHLAVERPDPRDVDPYTASLALAALFTPSEAERFAWQCVLDHSNDEAAGRLLGCCLGGIKALSNTCGICFLDSKFSATASSHASVSRQVNYYIESIPKGGTLGKVRAMCELVARDGMFVPHSLKAPNELADLTTWWVRTNNTQTNSSEVTPLGSLASDTRQAVGPASNHVTPNPATLQLSIADELAKLAELRRTGVLTEEEFATQKSKLLDV